MRLLLDEHYSPLIAEQLRERGHDVTAITGAPALEGLDDESLLGVAAGEGRALLTNNVRDFVPLARAWAASGREHSGLIFTSDASMPRARETIGVYVDALRCLLDREPEETALRGRVEWL